MLLELNKKDLFYGVEFWEKDCFDKLRKIVIALSAFLPIVLSVFLPGLEILFKTGMFFIIKLNSILKSSFFLQMHMIIIVTKIIIKIIKKRNNFNSKKFNESLP